ncbi:MAG: hypothetical protein M3174_00610, partial [Actinomycetota bacterium]|nr:hypothetical protein [Actinomycetota bacterium]
TRTGRRFVAVSSLMAIAAVLLPLAPPAVANHGGRTLRVTPESVARTLGGTHTLTATLSRAANVTSGTINIDFENESGVNDIDGTSLQSPDLTCSIPAGSTSCTVTYTGSNAGRDQWRVWIDHDGRDADPEADTAEGRNETAQPGVVTDRCVNSGTTTEPDCTDVVEVLWGTGGLDCDDAGAPDTERNTNPSGGGTVSNEVYTCTLTNAAGAPVEEATIRAEVENDVNDPDATDGASHNSPDYTCETGTGQGQSTAGVCRITVTQNENETGTADICFWSGTVAEGATLCADEAVEEAQETDQSDSANDFADRVQKTWEVRSAATGGLDAEPETARSALGVQHEIVATIYDQFGAPFNANTVVSVEFFEGSPSDTDGNTPESPDATCTTTNASTCTITYTQVSIPGTDLMCVWTNAAPEMAGTNNNGTCDGEGLADADDTAGAGDPSEPRNDDVDVVQKIWQQPTNAVRVDCEPESSKARRNTTATITCTATDAAGVPVVGAELDAEAIGANDPDAGDAGAAPDLSCVTGTQGTCSFSHGPRGVGTSDVEGTTFYRVWIDADNDNATVEADVVEGRDEATQPGNTETDNTDVVAVTWTGIRCDLVGTARADRLVGTAADETICGFDGNDRIIGGGGNDRILGDDGKDDIEGNKGADRIEGLGGHDTIRGSKGHDWLRGGPGSDRLYGGEGRDSCGGGTGDDSVSGCER